MAGKARNSQGIAPAKGFENSYLPSVLSVSLIRSRWLALALVVLMPASLVRAQFYSGSQQEYGKNRVQYQDFLWQQYRFRDMEVYFYKEGRDLARYTAMAAERHLRELEVAFDF
jgi:hypothetical protein